MKYQIRFSLAQPQYDIPEEYLQRYATLKEMCEAGASQNDWISRAWLDKLDVPTLSILNRSEGGIGGNNNTTDRQIRYETALGALLRHSDIVLNATNSSDGSSIWSVDDLLSLITPLQDVLEEYLGENALLSRVAVSYASRQNRELLEEFRITMWKPVLMELDPQRWPTTAHLNNTCAMELKAMYEGHPSNLDVARTRA
jgi:hypothetical protein